VCKKVGQDHEVRNIKGRPPSGEVNLEQTSLPGGIMDG